MKSSTFYKALFFSGGIALSSANAGEIYEENQTSYVISSVPPASIIIETPSPKARQKIRPDWWGKLRIRVPTTEEIAELWMNDPYPEPLAPRFNKYGKKKFNFRDDMDIFDIKEE